MVQKDAPQASLHPVLRVNVETCVAGVTVVVRPPAMPASVKVRSVFEWLAGLQRARVRCQSHNARYIAC